MAALTASTSSVTGASGSGSLHGAVDKLAAGANQPLYIDSHREKFHERALRDATTGQNSDTALMLDPTNPLLVKEEMEAQKDYFRRLKFTYLEQEAKRNFLVCITGDEPTAIPEEENDELERTNAEKKATLKAYKADTEEMRMRTTDLAKENATKNATIKQRLTEAQSLQKQIREAELEMARIRAKYPPEMRLTPSQAEEILDSQIAEMQGIEDANGDAKAKVEVTRDKVASMAKEVSRLNRDREREEARAKEVQQGREAGDTKVDDLCQWLNTSMQFYKSLLGIRNVRATSAPAKDGLPASQSLHLEYSVPSPDAPAPKARRSGAAKDEGKVVGLELVFESSSRRLINAQLSGSYMNIDEALNRAIRSQDVAGLVGDILLRLRGSA